MSDIHAIDALTIVPPARPLTGLARPPGSKSITNRVLLLAALAPGTSHITGALKSLDTTLMARALRQMGVTITEPDATSFVVKSHGQLTAPAEALMLGNAGTAMRFLTAAVALVDGPVTVDGDAHMRKRPIGALTAALSGMGVDISDTAGCPPVMVRGRGSLPGGLVEIDGSLSSQYVSALLMVAPRADGPVELQLTGDGIGARGYIDLTVAAMRQFGAQVTKDGRGSWHIAPTGYRAAEVAVEPDASAATYLWAAAVLTGGGIDLGIDTTRFIQPDAAAAPVIEAFPHLPDTIDGSQMQDAIPTLAVLAAFAENPVRFTGIANLRVKECDRIRALSTELNRIAPGLAEERGDDLIVRPDPRISGAVHPTRIETYADHRIAMSFALAGLRVQGITILDPACTGKTWPEYWRVLSSLGVEFRT
ncbi:MAG: 3-phosphoshikimate 1-carboxyvinyltransferase [Pseudomonadota bacterium]